MTVAQPDSRDAQRKLLDEQIAAESQLPPPDLAADAQPVAVEERLRQLPRRPVAVVGIVENGLIRPLDPQVHLPERSRVIIVASERP
jgi:hypothetical protein